MECGWGCSGQLQERLGHGRGLDCRRQQAWQDGLQIEPPIEPIAELSKVAVQVGSADPASDAREVPLQVAQDRVHPGKHGALGRTPAAGADVGVVILQTAPRIGPRSRTPPGTPAGKVLSGIGWRSWPWDLRVPSMGRWKRYFRFYFAIACHVRAASRQAHTHPCEISFVRHGLEKACTAPDCLDQRLTSGCLLGDPSLARLVGCASA